LTLQGKDTNIFCYAIDFGAHIDPKDSFAKRSAIDSCKEMLAKAYGWPFLQAGNEFFALQRVDDTLEFEAASRAGPTRIKFIPRISFNLNLEVETDENKRALINKFLNMIVKDILRKKKFNQIGRLPKYFLTSEKKPIQDFNIEMWPGYEVNIRICRSGVFLNSDTATKFVNRQTFLSKIEDLIHEQRIPKKEVEAMFDSSNIENKRVTVITSYGSQRSYQIDGITFDLNPASCEFKFKESKDAPERVMNMKDYFEHKYKVRLRDPKQPLIVVHRYDGNIYLPSELCHEASLPANFTKDARAMREIRNYKISNPTDRVKRLEKLIEVLQTENQVLKEWNVNLVPNMI